MNAEELFEVGASLGHVKKTLHRALKDVPGGPEVSEWWR